jgi:hypothetical protein
VCHICHPPHPPPCNHPNNIRWRTQASKFVTQFFPRSLSLLGLNILLNTVLRNPQSVFLTQSERRSFTSIQYKWQNYSLVCSNL